jgi:hypothetical protein
MATTANSGEEFRVIESLQCEMGPETDRDDALLAKPSQGGADFNYCYFENGAISLNHAYALIDGLCS